MANTKQTETREQRIKRESQQVKRILGNFKAPRKAKRGISAAAFMASFSANGGTR
jgi:hypothetical protein